MPLALCLHGFEKIKINSSLNMDFVRSNSLQTLFNPKLFNPKLQPWTFQQATFQPWTFQPWNFQPWFFEPWGWKVHGWKVWGCKVQGWNVLQPSREMTFQARTFQPWTFQPNGSKIHGGKVWGWKVKGWSLELKIPGLRCPLTVSSPGIPFFKILQPQMRLNRFCLRVSLLLQEVFKSCGQSIFKLKN